MSLGSESGFADTEFKESSGIRFSSSVTAEILKITENGILYTQCFWKSPQLYR